MMTRKNNWLLTAVQMGLLAWSGATLAADKVYVANEGADTVSVLDAASFKTLASVRVGKAPHNVQVSPDGKVVWVTNNGEPAQTADASEHKEMAQGSHDAMGKPGAVWAIDTATALLHKSEGRRDYPSPRRSYAMAPTGTVLGRPSCVKRLSRATRTCNSTTCRSNVRAITRWPRRLKQCILVSTRLLR